MKRDRDIVMRFVDICEEMGPLGGLVFIFGGTAIVMGFGILVVWIVSAIAGALS